jgi:hypothetical protein
MTVTLASTQTELALWLEARSQAAGGLSFSLNGRSLTRHNLAEINSMIGTLTRQERSFLDAARSGKSATRMGFSVAKFN